TTPPDISCIGRTNPYRVSFVEPPAAKPADASSVRKVAVGLGVVGSPTREYTLGVQVANTSAETFEKISVAFAAEAGQEIPFTETATEPLAPGHQRGFVLPFQSFTEVKRLAGTLPPDQYGFVIRSDKEELLRIPSEHVRQALAHLEKVSQGQQGDQ